MQLPTITQQKPDISIGNFKIWLYEKEPNESVFFYAGVSCSTPNSLVFIEGPYVDFDSLRAWKYECEQLYKNLSGSAVLSFYEPHVYARIILDKKGQGSLFVQICCPDTMSEEHTFTFEIDQTYVQFLLNDLTNLLGS